MHRKTAVISVLMCLWHGAAFAQAGPQSAPAQPSPQTGQPDRLAALEASGNGQALLAAVLPAAEAGNQQAETYVGRLFSEGKYGIPVDYPQAARWFQKAGMTGGADAQYRLGVLYYDGGIGLPKDPNLALSWIQRSADLGNLLAIQTLGDFSYAGLLIPKDEAKAVAFYKEAAEGGLESGQIRLGGVLLSSKGPVRDRERGAVWWTVASYGGDAAAVKVRGLLPPILADMDAAAVARINAAAKAFITGRAVPR